MNDLIPTSSRTNESTNGLTCWVQSFVRAADWDAASQIGYRVLWSNGIES